jgi:type VI secretion system protein
MRTADNFPMSLRLPDFRRHASACRASLRRLLRLMFVMCVTQALAGCGIFGSSGEKVSWSQMTLTASDDVNNDAPVAVDVVLVSDRALLERIADLPASKWFSARADLAATFPQGLRYRSWEMVPGQRLTVPGDTFSGPRVAAAFVFANYQGPGAHRVRIDTFSGRVAVLLNATALAVSATP